MIIQESNSPRERQSTLSTCNNSSEILKSWKKNVKKNRQSERYLYIFGSLFWVKTFRTVELPRPSAASEAVKEPTGLRNYRGESARFSPFFFCSRSWPALWVHIRVTKNKAARLPRMTEAVEFSELAGDSHKANSTFITTVVVVNEFTRRATFVELRNYRRTYRWNNPYGSLAIADFALVKFAGGSGQSCAIFQEYSSLQ